MPDCFILCTANTVHSILRRTLGPKTSIMVMEVLSWVRVKARKYFMSGPQLGRIRTLRSTAM